MIQDSSKPERQTIHRKEVWKPIPSHPNYEASNLGLIRSVRVRVLKQRRNHRTLGGDTHCLVHIRNRQQLVHRLVDEAFRGQRPTGIIVHHRDNVMTNNSLGNLQRVTYSQNTLYAYRDGRIGKRYKLNPFQRCKLVELYNSGKISVKDLAIQFGVHRQSVLWLLRKAGVKPLGMRKLLPIDYKVMRDKYVPFKYSVRRLAEEYKVSRGLVEWILGMRRNRGKLCAIGLGL